MRHNYQGSVQNAEAEEKLIGTRKNERRRKKNHACSQIPKTKHKIKQPERNKRMGVILYALEVYLNRNLLVEPVTYVSAKESIPGIRYRYQQLIQNSKEKQL